jgi:hypothetical protein
MAHLAGADAIGDGDCHAFPAEQGFTRNAGAMEVLIDCFMATVGALANRHL